jgi:hypothetical protein
MPSCLFAAYVEQIEAVTAERLLSMADAALYAQLTPESGRTWREAVARRLAAPRRAARNGRSDVPHHRSSLFFWNGEALDPRALTGRLAGHLKAGFSRD